MHMEFFNRISPIMIELGKLSYYQKPAINIGRLLQGIRKSTYNNSLVIDEAFIDNESWFNYVKFQDRFPKPKVLSYAICKDDECEGSMLYFKVDRLVLDALKTSNIIQSSVDEYMLAFNKSKLRGRRNG